MLLLLRFSQIISFLVILAVLSLTGTVSSGHRVAAASGTCKVLLSLDVSGSIGQSWSTFAAQVKSLLHTGTNPQDATGNPRNDVELGFMTFSHFPDSTDFNKSYSNGYVKTNSGPGTPGVIDFETALDNVSLDAGLTNYAQGFGYNAKQRGGTDNNNFDLYLSTNPAIGKLIHPVDSLRGEPDLVILLTDGQPNAPGLVDAEGFVYNFDGNDAAVRAAIAAREQYVHAKFAGAYINSDAADAVENLVRIIPDDPVTHGSNVASLRINGTLNNFINDNISHYCGPDVIASYNLQPVVTLSANSSSFIVSGSSPQFDYNVIHSGTDASTSWEIYDVQISSSAGIGTTPFNCGGVSNPYCDTDAMDADGCAYIYTLIGGAGNGNRCSRSMDEGGVGNSGNLSNISQSMETIYSGRSAAIDDANLSTGTRICRILRLSRPTESGRPVYRLSGACVAVGKTPLIQVLGGDIRVGRYFAGDNEDGSAASSGIYTSTTKGTVEGVETMFGSWVEYGALAPGPIVNFASRSGYSGGFPTSSLMHPSSGCPIEVNRLTFANNGTAHCGDLKQSMGLIPDVVAALRSWTQVVDSNVVSALQLGAASAPGMYKNTNNTSGGITIGASEITSGAGHTYIVYAPNKTVTIAGNITIKDYATQEYESINDIPQVIIIAKNIHIDKDVTNIDAWLIAQGGGSDGVINTCVGYTPPFSGRVCTEQLYINGPVMARQLLPWRTVANATDQPAETINLPASSLLWAISQTKPNRIQTTYTTELPPFF